MTRSVSDRAFETHLQVEEMIRMLTLYIGRMRLELDRSHRLTGHHKRFLERARKR